MGILPIPPSASVLATKLCFLVPHDWLHNQCASAVISVELLVVILLIMGVWEVSFIISNVFLLLSGLFNEKGLLQSRECIISQTYYCEHHSHCFASLHKKKRGEEGGWKWEGWRESGKGNRLASTPSSLPSNTRRDTKYATKFLKGLSIEFKEGTFFLNIVFFRHTHRQIKLFLYKQAQYPSEELW